MRLRTSVVCLCVVLAASAIGPAAHAAPAAGTPVASGAAPEAGEFGPLADLLIERLRLADLVAAAKFGTGRPIDDPVREAELLATVRTEAAALGIDVDAAVAVFTDQIAASKVVQRGLFERWTEHPGEAPAPPDLGQVRTELDRLTHAILAELTATERLRHGDPLCRVHLVVARIAGAVEHRLDVLHRRALDVAVGSVCVPR
ncbi:gamma subclass chorismate mutase AroQ [Amycolatopsis suaedae]|uniref:chorismate mutase n=1 Tax=Amycolatopsis suaedae TaxID=2510978 RepID=A0A4Q7J7W3_9PSEU|nr:gamma subclass chorismate mutase AroQ [Amycolatopsis suaedae]RZQ62453.1 gamma subclass chorismate mutase AroQ [Amycolatopsis suaedae]